MGLFMVDLSIILATGYASNPIAYIDTDRAIR